MGRIGNSRRALAIATAVAAAMALAVLPVGAQQVPSGEPLFVTASVDNDQPYIGQQVTYVSKIYQRSDSSRKLHYEPPGFAGFWNVRAPEQDKYEETIDSNAYNVIELRTLLFPSVVGTIEIEPAEITASDGSEATIVVESLLSWSRYVRRPRMRRQGSRAQWASLTSLPRWTPRPYG